MMAGLMYGYRRTLHSFFLLLFFLPISFHKFLRFNPLLRLPTLFYFNYIPFFTYTTSIYPCILLVISGLLFPSNPTKNAFSPYPRTII